jgi:hypothetical protein
MCALYENYLINEEDGMNYEPNSFPHCLANRDRNNDGTIILDFDRYIDRECHAPSYHKLLLVDDELSNASTLEEAYNIFAQKYIGETNNMIN